MQYDVRDVSRMMGVAESQVYRWINEAQLPTRKVNGKFAFNRAELLEWATQRRLSIVGDLFARAGADEPSLAAALQAGGDVRELQAGDKESALRGVVATLPLPPGTDRAALCELFLAREAVGSTAVGEGVAIPHPRYPVILPLDRPLLGVFYLVQPIEFAAADGLPVHTLFVLACPTMRTHLHLLSRLATALHEPGFRGAVTSRGAFGTLVDEAERIDQACFAQSAALVPAAGGNERV
jgi:PTS system nitrogen regulatory IIA component